jgi:hypothetical protein
VIGGHPQRWASSCRSLLNTCPRAGRFRELRGGRGIRHSLLRLYRLETGGRPEEPPVRPEVTQGHAFSRWPTISGGMQSRVWCTSIAATLKYTVWFGSLNGTLGPTPPSRQGTTIGLGIGRNSPIHRVRFPCRFRKPGAELPSCRIGEQMLLELDQRHLLADWDANRWRWTLMNEQRHQRVWHEGPATAAWDGPGSPGGVAGSRRCA